MKRKRVDEEEHNSSRPLFKKEELLCVTCELVLDYNRHFTYDYTDMQLYYAAEQFDVEQLFEFNTFLQSILQENTFVDRETILQKFRDT